MLSDLGSIFLWWFLIFSLGLISLPINSFLFSKFWDKGYIFSKTISFVILTYLIFVGGVIKFLPFNQASLYLLIFLIFLFNFLFLRKQKKETFLTVLKSKYKIFIFEEIIFLLVLLLWSLIRSFNPDIEGLEKYMDWGFINSALRSTFLPPQDMWFSGEIINYYYFGHLIFAVLTKLSHISSAITYNLSVATLCSLTFLSSFSIASNFVFLSQKSVNLKKIIIVGLISALLLTFGGNLHSIYKIIKIDIKNNNHLVLTKNAFTKAANTYWYPDATRFIGYDPDTKDKTIHEFPIYSFVVSDLHGHMNDIPIILFFIAFLFALSFLKSKLINLFLVIISGFNLLIAYMTNAWDFAVYGLLFACFTFFINLKNNNFNKAIIKTFLNGLLTIVAWFIFSLPFSLNFAPMGNGIKVSDVHTPFYQLFILYGGFWLICLPFILLIIKKIIKDRKIKIRNSDLFVFSIFIIATILIILPEFIYLKDIYIYEYRRANTMFKLVYQAFILYALISGYCFYKARLLLKSKIINNIYGFIFALIFIIHLVYPYFAIKSFYSFKNYYGLWGLNYLKNDYPDNFKAINWINQNIKGQPVMLEAVGDSYTTFNQVSVSTGLPTVQGWVVHEWLWRGGYDKPKARQDDVQTIYQGKDIEKIKQLIKKYNIQYIFVGSKEYEKYSNLNDDNFIKIGGKVVFQSGKTKIYQL